MNISFVCSCCDCELLYFFDWNSRMTMHDMRKAQAIYVALARTQNCWRVGQYTTFRFRYGAIHVCYRTRKEISCVTFFLVDKYRFRRNCCYDWFVCMCWSVCKIGVLYTYACLCVATRAKYLTNVFMWKEKEEMVLSVIAELHMNGNRTKFKLTDNIFDSRASNLLNCL